MSYTVTSYTPPFSPVYNEMVFIAKDTANFYQEQYHYICWVYDGTGTILLATIKLYPDQYAQGLFDIHRILENYVGFDFFVSDVVLPNFEPRANSFVSYITEFGYEYGIVGSTGTPYSSGVTVTNNKAYAWNGIFDYEDFITQNAAQYASWQLVSTQTNNWLTNMPSVIDCRPGCSLWLSVMTNWGTAKLVDHLCMKTYDFNGNIIATYRDYSNTVPYGVDTGKFLQVPAGHLQLNNTGRLPTSVNYYTLTLEDSSNNALTNTITVHINYNSSKYTWYRLHFLNKLGGFDAFDFRQKSKKMRNSTTQNYQRLGGFAGAYNDGVTLQTTERELTQYDTLVKPTITIESDWISDAESVWLEELLSSPQVFIENTAGSNTTFTPVVINTSSYEVKQRANGPTMNLKLELQYHYNKYRQRG